MGFDNQKKEKKENLNTYSVIKEASTFYHKELYVNINKKVAINYLKRRGISGSTAKKFFIGFAEDKWNTILNFLSSKKYQQKDIINSGLCKIGRKGIHDIFRDRIIFPIKDIHGKTIAFGGRSIIDDIKPKYLNSPENYLFKKSQNLYGLFEAKEIIREQT